MHTTVICCERDTKELTVTSRLQVVMACEDAAAIRHAEGVCRKLASRLVEEFEVNAQCWTFSELADLPLRLCAAGQAAKADIILVACRGERTLPQCVRSWLDLWTGSEGNPGTLVLLLDARCAAPRAHAELAWCLQHAAARGQMDFVVSESPAPRGETEAPVKRATPRPCLEPALAACA